MRKQMVNVILGLVLTLAACQSPLSLQEDSSPAAAATNESAELGSRVLAGQNGLIYQYFHWYTTNNGTWWDTLKNDAVNLDNKGVTAVWMPPAYKGDAGTNDVGYGVYDHYDLGEFLQKGSVRTKYGTRQQYLDAIAALKARGIQAYGDIVMNHKGGADAVEQVQAVRVNWDNRNLEEGSDLTIGAWTRFDFPGRGNTYSPFKWRWWHFDGVDWNQNTSEKRIFKFRGTGKSWDWEVSPENGNYDYLMYADVDFDHPEVDAEFKTWGNWYMNTASLDGLRIDAVKHIKFTWFNGWLDHLRGPSGQNRNFFALGEFVTRSLGDLTNFITKTGRRMSLFDFPLHYNFEAAGYAGGNYDMRTIFNNTLTAADPTMSVPFVDNHDTQPLQALASPVPNWFKPIAYTLILTREAGYPMVFWLDEFGGTYTDKGQTVTIPPTPKLDKIMEARKLYAYGPQTDYLDHWDIIGWTRQGAAHMPNSGLAALVTDGPGGTKSMFVGTHFAGRQFYDLTGNVSGTVTINSSGWGTFSVTGGSFAIWVPQPAAAPPAAPTNLSAAAAGSSQINLTWTASAGATSYNVLRATSSTGTYTSVGTTAGTSFSSTGLNPSTTYWYRVTASNSGGTSGVSNTASATTTAAGAGLRVHFLTNSVANWSSVNIYYWASNGSPASNAWPGQAMTNSGGGWWTFTIPGSSSANIIFNNGTTQTIDLSRTAEGWFTPTGTSNGKITGTWSNTAPGPSSNADLSALSFSAGSLSPAFAAGTTSYSVSTTASSTTVTATRAHSGATLAYQLNGGSWVALTSGSASASLALAVGTNTVNVRVTAENGTTVKTYATTVTRSSSSGTPGRLTIIFRSGANAETVSFPGDANNWSLTANTLSIGANSQQTINIDNGVTSTTLARGSSTTQLEMKLVSNASWNNQWSFGTWTRSSNITLSDSNRQIHVTNADANDHVTITIDVSTLSLSATVIPF